MSEIAGERDALMERLYALADEWYPGLPGPRRMNSWAQLTREKCARELRDALPAREVWDDSAAPGGYVCSRCGWSTESEPCEHLATRTTPPGSTGETGAGL